jgi:septal ring factor EnvC (AmiA/AmiB activator)
MKRLILEIILGVLVLTLSVTTYIFFSKSKLVSSKEQEVVNLNLESDKLKSQINELTNKISESSSQLDDYNKLLSVISTAKIALKSGIAINDINAASEATGSDMISERHLAIGAISMIINGENDPLAIASFEKALELVDLKTKLNAVCAAQNGLSASGRDIKVLSECAPTLPQKKDNLDAPQNVVGR